MEESHLRINAALAFAMFINTALIFPRIGTWSLRKLLRASWLKKRTQFRSLKKMQDDRPMAYICVCLSSCRPCFQPFFKAVEATRVLELIVADVTVVFLRNQQGVVQQLQLGRSRWHDVIIADGRLTCSTLGMDCSKHGFMATTGNHCEKLGVSLENASLGHLLPCHSSCPFLPSHCRPNSAHISVVSMVVTQASEIETLEFFNLGVFCPGCRLKQSAWANEHNHHVWNGAERFGGYHPS